MTTTSTNRVLGVKFRQHGQLYYFVEGEQEVAPGDKIVVETEQGQGIGVVALIDSEPPEELAGEELKVVDRLATPDDLVKEAENDALSREAFSYCRKCIRERGLEMKLVDVEVYFDHSKVIFYFTAPTRIDFRELVKDLVKNYRTRIELRQIGVRHETQMIGALGNCGMVCCCRRYLRKFAPVTIKMAKEQNLFLNPNKISGMCGRLLCCLSYEQANYEAFNKQCPKIGKKFQTSIGPVKVLRANLFRQSLALMTEAGEEREVSLEEWQALEPHRLDPQQQQAQQKQAQLKQTQQKQGEERRENNRRERPPREPKNAKPAVQPDKAPAAKEKEPIFLPRLLPDEAAKGLEIPAETPEAGAEAAAHNQDGSDENRPKRSRKPKRRRKRKPKAKPES